MRILVVVEDKVLALSIVRRLRELSLIVDLAQDVQEAEWLANQTPYDAILVRSSLSDKNSLSLLKRLRTSGIMIPSLILTKKDVTEHQSPASGKRHIEHLRRPFDLEELFILIQSIFHLETNSWLAPSQESIDLCEEDIPQLEEDSLKARK